jgi:hypothetical protein
MLLWRKHSFISETLIPEGYNLTLPPNKNYTYGKDLKYNSKHNFPRGKGELGEMAVEQNAHIDFVCYLIALAT